MPTIEEAKSKDKWTITGVLIHKRIFIKRKPDSRKPNTTILTLTLVDEKGQVIEFKTFKTRKSYCVYRKVNENKAYIVTGDSEIKPPAATEFTNSDYETVCDRNKNWFITRFDDSIQVKSLNCMTKLNKKALKQKPANILALYVEMFKGPTLYRPPVQGYFARLIDDTGVHFLVLVWHTIRIEKSKFPLFNCNKGDFVLITSARASTMPPPAGHSNLYTLTAIPPPVVDSSCVASRIKQDFKNKLRKSTQAETN